MKRPAAKRQALFKPHTLVVVTWLDAHFDLDDETECEPMMTVGYVIKHTQSKISIASEANARLDYFRAHTSIPAAMVLTVVELAPREA